MLTFIGTILTVYIVWLLIKPLLLMYIRKQYTKKVSDMFNQAFGQQAGSSRADYGSSTQHRPQPARNQRKKKIFSREDGEYVDFEEIGATPDRQSGRHDPNYAPREPQVSDADWEEIN